MTNSPTLSVQATQAGIILGTAAYMAPEQAHGRAADRRADIFSFGAVLFEILTGTQAFGEESISDTLASVLKLDPDWHRLPEDTPGAIRTLLRRCLTKDRAQRLQAIGEARIVLAQPALERPAENRNQVAGQLRLPVGPRHSRCRHRRRRRDLGLASTEATREAASPPFLGCRLGPR